MNVILIDDDVLVTSSLKTIIESNSNISVIAIGKSGEDAVQLYKKHSPDVLLMDIRMGEFNGIDAAKSILASDENAKILFLTTFSDDNYIISALKIGAKGYILKQNFNNIIPSLEAVMSGQNVFGNEIVTKIPNLFQKADNQDMPKYDLTRKGIRVNI